MATTAAGRSCMAVICNSKFLLTPPTFRRAVCNLRRRRYSAQAFRKPHAANFGLLFDIDGVIVRGREVLPSSKEAISLLTDQNTGKFKVPCVFVTNAGNALRSAKAEQLSNWLGVPVSQDQVVMSHSPLKLFKQFHNKTVLVSGQGPVLQIAKNLGFTKVVTIENLKSTFPMLDMVDHTRRRREPGKYEKFFPKIEAIVLFGEPVRWETNLQLILDLLLTNGKPDTAPEYIPYPHIPLLACNMDLMWMAEACMPRFGHGCFLHCLEGLYHKITGRHIQYTALIGKPSEITYHHAEYVINQHAESLGLETPLHRLYAIGDNPETDIYGANLYNRYLRDKRFPTSRKQKMSQGKGGSGIMLSRGNGDGDPLYVLEDDCEVLDCADSIESILVLTGVYDKSRDYKQQGGDKHIFNHNHRDFTVDEDLKMPTFTVKNVLEAVKLVYEEEQFYS
ncbi:haloacid dehalogenase-like hydrolase domain-containing 5 isoform X1 [Lingula anatina]|uniref:Haloacid dehalogenase-like hydrolase domain-containing 5 n=1 Tax=Lingula anatina TaxID=7574 RepID=A0A1S3I7E5_LINAN|nr:haloacid dehalogenase-like hydrolase domain-containing 5 isoform X1 [Lingula anatina]|eukprot:XP_013394123.1 haloacid dehalogenase-like hydrolase domain-containing 5 isoform X1 [Lingula anatina]